MLNWIQTKWLMWLFMNVQLVCFNKFMSGLGWMFLSFLIMKLRPGGFVYFYKLTYKFKNLTIHQSPKCLSHLSECVSATQVFGKCTLKHFAFMKFNVDLLVNSSSLCCVGTVSLLPPGGHMMQQSSFDSDFGGFHTSWYPVDHAETHCRPVLGSGPHVSHSSCIVTFS